MIASTIININFKYQQLYYLAIDFNRYLILFVIYLIIIWRFKRELFRTISARTVPNVFNVETSFSTATGFQR